MTEEVEAANESMIRWQGYARDSRTAVNSHFLAYSGAILALQTSVLLDKEIQSVAWPCIFVSAGLLSLLSLTLGSVIVLVRLRDARLTARIARYRHQGEPPEKIDSIRKAANCFGKWTNRLIPFQVLSFCGAAMLFCAWVVAANWAKLW